MFCCTGFENLIACTGERGFSILAHEAASGKIGFLFQSRGLAYGDEAKVKPIDIDVKINVSAEIGLRYCPFCGYLLEELIQKNPDFFAKLANEHFKLLAHIPNP